MNYEPQFRDAAARNSKDVAEADGQQVAGGRRRAIVIAIAAGVLLLILAALFMGRDGADAPAPGGAAAGEAGVEVPRVSVIAVQPASLSMEVSGTGAIAARRDMPVGVEGEGGRVVAVLVEPGDRVRAGQVLARIDRSVQEQQVRSLTAQVAVARADADLAESNLSRARALVDRGFISAADLESRGAARDAAVARVNVATAQLNQARASMARLDVRAPAGGLVLTRSVEAGQIVSAGSGVLFRIARDGQMEMQMAVNESDLVRVTVGDKATVQPVGSDRVLTGTVWQVSAVVNTSTRQGMARILLDYDPALRPGAFAQARIITGATTGVMLPQSAILTDDQGSFVYVVNAGNRVTRRPVTTGPVTEAGVSVLSGLNRGDRVVSTAGGFVKAGDQVEPTVIRQPVAG